MKDKILYADDEETLRRALGMVLKIEFPELDIEPFKDGSSLEKRLNESLEGVRLVITDNDMPGVNGSTLIMNYAQKTGFENIPFILFSGGDESIGREFVKKHRAYAYVTKGIGYRDLIKIAGRALKSRVSSQ